MSDSNKNNATNEEIKELLIIQAKEIKSFSEILIQDLIDNKKSFSPFTSIHRIITLAFAIDRISDKKLKEASDVFTKHIL